MLRKCVILTTCVTTLVFHSFCRADQPIGLHPENGHYFNWLGKPTVLITSGEHYGALLNLDFDFVRYFAALRKDGLNHTRVFSGTYRELPGSHGIQANTLAPKPNRYLSPWKRSEVPGYHDGGNKFDLLNFDPEYFHRLRQLMTEAKKQGIVIELTLFCPLYSEGEWLGSPMNPKNNINHLGNWPKDDTLSLKVPELVAIQEAFVRKVVQELNTFDNLYFEVCNEPYIRKVPDDWQMQMLKVIRETENELPNRHLISLNIANGSRKIEKQPDGVSIFNFHYCVPPVVVGMNFQLNKVIGENETGFRGRNDYLYRSEGWDFMMAGGGLYNNLDYSFTVEHPEGDLREFRAPGGGSPELRKQLGILKSFMESLDFIHMKPEKQVISKSTTELVWQALAQSGKDYAIYLHAPLPDKPKKIDDYLRQGIETEITLQIPAGKYEARWISPTTGNTVKQDAWEQRPNVDNVINSPKFDNDIVLRIHAVDGQ